jgi:hypothetical protein
MEERAAPSSGWRKLGGSESILASDAGNWIVTNVAPTFVCNDTNAPLTDGGRSSNFSTATRCAELVFD